MASVFIEVRLGWIFYSMITAVCALLIPYFAVKFPISQQLFQHNESVLIGFSGSVMAVWGIYWVLFKNQISRFYLIISFVPVVVRISTLVAIPIIFFTNRFTKNVFVHDK